MVVGGSHCIVAKVVVVALRLVSVHDITNKMTSSWMCACVSLIPYYINKDVQHKVVQPFPQQGDVGYTSQHK